MEIEDILEVLTEPMFAGVPGWVFAFIVMLLTTIACIF
jgi:hypothetical protein